MDKKIDDVVGNYTRILRSEARTLDSAANVASGKGEYGLANQIWWLAQQLRDKAKELETSKTIQD